MQHIYEPLRLDRKVEIILFFQMKSLGIEKIPATGGLADYRNGAIERRFSPYSDNGGSLVAIAGEDYAIIASDTRLSGRSVYSSIMFTVFPLF